MMHKQDQVKELPAGRYSSKQFVNHCSSPLFAPV